MNFDQSQPSSTELITKTSTTSATEDLPGTFEASIKKRKRQTKAQREEMLATVRSGYLAGNPPIAIMLQLGLSQTQLQGLLVELFTKHGMIPKEPTYSVIEGTESIKKQLNLLRDWAYIKIVAETDGSYRLSEYEVQ